MALGVGPYRVEDEGLAEEHFNLVVRPVLCGEGLEKHDDALFVLQREVENVIMQGCLVEIVKTYLEVHFAKFVAPAYEECGADVEVEL